MVAKEADESHSWISSDIIPFVVDLTAGAHSPSFSALLSDRGRLAGAAQKVSAPVGGH